MVRFVGEGGREESLGDERAQKDCGTSIIMRGESDGSRLKIVLRFQTHYSDCCAETF